MSWTLVVVSPSGSKSRTLRLSKTGRWLLLLIAMGFFAAGAWVTTLF